MERCSFLKFPNFILNDTGLYISKVARGNGSKPSFLDAYLQEIS